ncbi:uncharacterized protein IWZ02DRAFT_429313 [Phyllosticta citriasiana]|uniref:Uncharacterized protein n=1 Tax=Phyllosticta citriasiana TaxID=595635 RepID=A0ABR1KBR1_9PEZI
MGDTIKTFFRNGSLRKQNKPIRPVQSLPYTIAASGAPPRQGLAPLKGDISPATHGIWTSTIETFDHLDSQTEQKQQPEADVAQIDSHISTIKANTEQARSPVAQRPENGRLSGVKMEEIPDLSEADAWDPTIGLALTTDHVRYIERAEGVDSHRANAGMAHAGADLTSWNHAAKKSSEETGANQDDFAFDLQAALDRASDFTENQSRSRQASHGTVGEVYGNQSQMLPKMMEF